MAGTGTGTGTGTMLAPVVGVVGGGERDVTTVPRTVLIFEAEG